MSGCNRPQPQDNGRSTHNGPIHRVLCNALPRAVHWRSVCARRTPSRAEGCDEELHYATSRRSPPLQPDNVSQQPPADLRGPNLVQSRHDADLRHAQSFGLTKPFGLTRLSGSPLITIRNLMDVHRATASWPSRDTTWQPLSRRNTYPPCDHSCSSGLLITNTLLRPRPLGHTWALHLAIYWPKSSPHVGHHAPHASWSLFPLQNSGCRQQAQNKPVTSGSRDVSTPTQLPASAGCRLTASAGRNPLNLDPTRTPPPGLHKLCQSSDTASGKDRGWPSAGSSVTQSGSQTAGLGG